MPNDRKLYILNNLALIICSLFIGLLGLIVMIGWYANIPGFFQVNKAWVAMVFNSALCFILFSATLLTYYYTYKKIAIITCSVAILMATVTLSQYIFSLNIGIDEFFVDAYNNTMATFPGRMAPNSALCFILAGVAYLLATKSTSNTYYSVTSVFISLFIIILGSVSIMGYFTSLTSMFRWGQLNPMAPNTSFGMIILGVGILNVIYKELKDNLNKISHWNPIFVVFFISSMTILLWDGVKNDQIEQVSNLTRNKASGIKKIIQTDMNNRILALTRMTQRWVLRTSTPKDEWLADANTLIKGQTGYKAIELVDSNFTTRWAASYRNGHDQIGYNLAHDPVFQPYLQESLKLKSTIMSTIINWNHGSKGFIIFSPIFKPTFEGFILGIIDPNILISNIINDEEKLEYGLEISASNIPFYVLNKTTNKYREKYQVAFDIPLYGTVWNAVIWPTPMLISMGSSVPNIILITGLFFAIMLGLLTHLNHVARSSIKDKNKAQNKLEHGLQELQYFNSNVLSLNEANSLLQACLTIEETFKPLQYYCQHVLKIPSGILYILNTNEPTKFDVAAAWGNLQNQTAHLDNGECWALRRSHNYQVKNTDTEIHCPHASSSSSYACLPLQIQGELLGLLHLQAASNHINLLTSSNAMLLNILSEQFCTSIINLQLRQNLHELSIRDPLTNLYNRRFADEFLHKILSQSERDKHFFGILMADIDYFKSINDTYGHQVGDAVLKLLSQEIETVFRKGDVCCRWSGEEFLIYLHDVLFDSLFIKAEEFRHHVENIDFTRIEPNLKTITLSIGVASFPAHGDTVEKIIKAADDALYNAKSNGRNIVVVAKSE